MPHFVIDVTTQLFPGHRECLYFQTGQDEVEIFYLKFMFKPYWALFWSYSSTYFKTEFSMQVETTLQLIRQQKINI